MNKQIHQYTAAVSIDAAADFFLIDPASSGVYKSINRNVALGLSSAPVGLTDSQTISTKVLDNSNTITLKDTLFTLQDDGDVTKQAKFQLSGITTGTTRTYTLPNTTDTLAGIAATQTLTNKTITSPTITGGTIDNSTITVDSIAGHTSSTIVTVANMQISNGVINSANAVTATSIAAGAVQPQALVTGTGSGWTWQSWSPTLTNLTQGAGGTLSCKYIQMGKTVFFRVKFIMGTGSAVGTNPTFTLPVTANSDYSVQFPVVGEGNALVAGAANYHIFIVLASTTTMNPLLRTVGGTYVAGNTVLTATVPATWSGVSSDYMFFEGYYEAA